MNDNDGLAAETRRLLDAATPGEWRQAEDYYVESEHPSGGMRRQVSCNNPADAALIAAAPRLLANWLAREDRPTREAEWVRAVQYGAKVVKQRDAAIAERDRLADENRALREREQGLLDAIAGQDPDQCAVCGDVYCSGAYCLEQMVAELPDEHQELPEPIEKVQDMVRLGRILSEWAAADRGTDR